MATDELEFICDALVALGVPFLRPEPQSEAQTDTAVVQLSEGFATFQWNETAGYVTAAHSLHSTDDIPPEIRDGFVERWARPGVPNGVLVIPDQPGGLTPGHIKTDLETGWPPSEVKEDVAHRIVLAGKYLEELAALATVSTWEATEATVEMVTSAPRS